MIKTLQVYFGMQKARKNSWESGSKLSEVRNRTMHRVLEILLATKDQIFEEPFR